MARNPTISKSTAVEDTELESEPSIPDDLQDLLSSANVGGIGGATIGTPDYSVVKVQPGVQIESPIVKTERYRVLAYARVNVGGLIAEVRPGKILDSAYDDIQMHFSQGVRLEKIED